MKAIANLPIVLLVCCLLHISSASVSSCVQDAWCWSNLSRYFYFQANTSDRVVRLPITLAEDNRVSFRIVNRIFSILLKEVLGYQEVEFNYRSNTLNSAGSDCSPASNQLEYAPPSQPTCFRPEFLYNSTRECSRNSPIPDAMIDLTSLSSAHHKPRSSENVLDTGFLGPVSSHGMFMSRRAVLEIWDKHQIVANDYRSLTKPMVASEFAIPTLNLSAYLGTVQNASGAYFCNTTDCQDGMFIPPGCEANSSACGVLLVGDTGYSVSQLKALIRSLKMLIRVAWLGPHLTSFIKMDAVREAALLIFTDIPEPPTSVANFTLVRFESCNGASGMPGCGLPRSELRKLIWSSLASLEPHIYQLVKNMAFSGDEFAALISNYSLAQLAARGSASLSEHEFACGWVSGNPAIWQRWIPLDAHKKPKLLLGGLFPIDKESAWKQSNVIPAVKMGVDKVNQDPNILPDYEIELLINDTACSSEIVLKTFVNYVKDVETWDRLVGGVGPACSDTAVSVAGVSKYFNFVLISYSVDTLVLSRDRIKYPYFFRTVPQIDGYAAVYLQLLKKMKWKQVSLLMDDSSREYPIFHQLLQEMLRKQNITIAFQTRIPRPRSVDKPFSYAKYLDDIKAANTKIIIATIFPSSAREIMCEAFKKNMTLKSGYVWFLPSWFNWDWYDTDYHNNITRENVSCSRENMTQGLRGYFTLAHAFLDTSDKIAEGNLNGTEWWRIYNEKLKEQYIVDPMTYPSDFGSYAYDAVWVFAKALHSLEQKNPGSLKFIHSDYVTKLYVEEISRTSFQGVSGSIIFNERGDRIGITDVNQYKTLDEEGFLKQTSVGKWTPHISLNHSSTGELDLDLDQIDWLSGIGPPNDGSPPGEVPMSVCSVKVWQELLGVPCETALIIAFILGSVAVVIFVALIIFLGLRRRFQQKIEARMEQLGLNKDDSVWFSLDRWEISRDSVVLNRKLGEGAFGTVYGGEALFQSSWIGVAVKTLKIGSTSDDKLDFLSEADMMKRFDHKNIVKLLGVTTLGEPIYTIMEFMLHGDLKTYLLSRRELVGTEEEIAGDISPSSLTAMATDVIEGIIYLHSREYIHRDLACRNCLVSAKRVVKIGDFGMTRSVYDHGYYRFTRKCKLPIRWMAPESLTDGIFTYKTDVWSYGILLYEIITFGSFPYQVLSNNQVFDYVKEGGILTLPEECTDELKALLLSCWAKDPKHRPEVSDISTTLKSSENMIQPLLASPVNATIREYESAELDMSPAPFKPLGLKKPLLRQSNSVISVDGGLGRTRITSDNSKRTKHKSSPSAVDINTANTHSALYASQSVPPTPLSLPSPNHTPPGLASAFTFSLDNRHVCDDVFCCEVRPTSKRGYGDSVLQMTPYSIHVHTPLLADRSQDETDL